MANATTQSTVPTVLQQASWIWPENPWWDLYNSYVLLRRTFTLATVPRKAVAYVTADQSYRLYVNGRYVTRGPARGFQSHWPYDEIDLAPYLEQGENTIALRAYNPGVSTYQYISQGEAGVLFALQAGAVRIVSDTTWKGRRQASVQRDTVPASIQLFPQEIVDARQEPDDWMMPGFDDSSWTVPHVSARFGGMPWPVMEERMIPLLREGKITARALVGLAEGTCAEGYGHTRDVANLRAKEGLEHRPVPVGAPSTAQALEVEPTSPGRFRSFLLDFGKTVVGCLELHVEGTTGGEIVDTFYTESMDAAKLRPDFFAETYCKMAFAGRLQCRAGTTRHLFYHPYGFRWLTITVRDAAVGCRVNVGLQTAGYPLERAGGFRSSDTMLEDIWETCAWTQQCCSLDAYVDTPWREQAQWWGDARVQSWNTFFLSGDARLTRRGIHCIASQTTPDHLTYGHSPTVAHNCILPDYTLMWMLTLWDYWWQTGSLEAFRAHSGVLEAALGYFEAHTDREQGLIAYDPRYWLFLDWTGSFDGTTWTGTMFKEGFSSVYNLWALITMEKVAQLQRLARRPEAAAVTMARARRLRKALARLVDPSSGLMRDGYRVDGALVASTCVHSQVLAMMAGLAGINEREMLDRVLLPCIRELPSPHIRPSVFWSTYLFSVLGERGYGAEVIAFIRRRWAPMVEQGTTFEIFDPFPGDSSRSHAWSAHPLFHLMQIIGGIRQAAPAWKKITFTPDFVGERAEVTVPTPHGPVRSSWKRSGNAISVALDLPRGVTAIAYLPGVRPQKVAGRGKWTVTLP